MKRQLLAVCLSLVALGCSSCFGRKDSLAKESVEMIREGFQKVPDSVRLAVYWYWMSDNISVRGVEEDLLSMKEAGITRAFIGNIGGQGVPYGKVRMFSDEWWEVLHAVLKKASELDIEGSCELTVKYSSRPMLERYAEKSLAKMFPRPLPLFDDYLWRKQPQVDRSLCIDPKEVIDLTDNVKDGILTWDAPEGDCWDKLPKLLSFTSTECFPMEISISFPTRVKKSKLYLPYSG